ncbi:VOC family protein [Aerococcaceae bacterium NML191292]|nr:VOC family protein [Aerococcaceae bacterium NML191292]MCW6664563.1 VOC family protein [Aerococcaceae bacterium NML191219]MCW6665992.1 VOC family protein [Aerococcaceae bacterium NML190938]
MQFNVNLLFNGQCEQAFAFYQQVLGGECAQGIIRYGEVLEDLPEECSRLVFYTELSFEHFTLRGQDVLEQVELSSGNLAINLDFTDETQGRAIYQQLLAEGEVLEPLEPVFCVSQPEEAQSDTGAPDLIYGKLTDQFGITWEILIHI